MGIEWNDIAAELGEKCPLAFFGVTRFVTQKSVRFV